MKDPTPGPPSVQRHLPAPGQYSGPWAIKASVHGLRRPAPRKGMEKAWEPRTAPLPGPSAYQRKAQVPIQPTEAPPRHSLRFSSQNAAESQGGQGNKGHSVHALGAQRETPARNQDPNCRPTGPPPGSGLSHRPVPTPWQGAFSVTATALGAGELGSHTNSPASLANRGCTGRQGSLPTVRAPLHFLSPWV